MRTSTTGNSNNARGSLTRCAHGFTLIELTVVILLAGIIMSLTVPRFQQVLVSDNLKSSARKMVGKITGLRNDAIRNHRDYYLRFDLDANRYWIEYSGMTELEQMAAKEKPSTFPDDVHVLDIWFFGPGKQETGETSIRFNKKGYIQPALIHLNSDDGRQLTLVLRPFLGQIQVTDEYLTSDNM